MLQAVQGFTSSALSAIHTPFAALYWCGCQVDKKIVKLTNSYLPESIAKVVQVFFHLAPYIVAAVLLPPLPSALTTLGIFGFKAIATMNDEHGIYFDSSGLYVGLGALGTVLGVMAAKEIVILQSAAATIPKVAYIMTGSYLLGGSISAVWGAVQAFFERSDIPN